MRQSTNALYKFINDFALKQPDGVVNFNSIIQFHVGNNMQKLTSNIHIVTSANLDTIYIMDLNTRSWELPDMFTAEKDSFTYIEQECLRIEGKGPAGNYVVTIYPLVKED